MSSNFPAELKDSPGARLRQIRLDRNMNIVDLAKSSGLSTITISYIELGQNKASLSTLKILAKILQTSVAFLGCFETLPEGTLGERILKARLFHGHTKREASKQIGVDVKTFWNWESNTTEPTPKILPQIKSYLTILEEDFLH